MRKHKNCLEIWGRRKHFSEVKSGMDCKSTPLLSFFLSIYLSLSLSLAFFYGHVPENYRVGHVEIHHGEGNDHGDVTSTLHVDRSKSGQFVRYMGDFAEFWSGITIVEYFNQKLRDTKLQERERKAALVARRRALSGMLAYYGVFAALCWFVSPFFAFWHYLEPHLEIINYLSAINYTWHTFVDPDGKWLLS